MPKVSVIMPAYNAEKYIGQAIDSILSQSFTDFECIILNDCSGDATEQIILSYGDDRIVYMKNEKNMGVAATLNRGLGVAKGEYIARMDADDISLPQRLEKQAAYLDAHPNVAVLGTWLERFGDQIPNQPRGFTSDARQMKVDLLFACGLAHPSVMMRRSVIARLGGYDLAYEGLEDYELWCRVAEEHDVTVLPEVLLRYRVHGGQVTKNPSEKYVERMGRLKTRQLERLGLPTQGTLAESYRDYCLGKRPGNRREAVDLCRFLESVITANETACRYDPELLRQTLRAVALGAAGKLGLKDGAAVCESTGLMSLSDMAAQWLKQGVKRLLGKGASGNEKK